MRLSPRLRSAFAEDLEPEHGVLQHRSPLEQVVLLQENSNLPAGAANALAVKLEVAFGRLDQAGNDRKQRRLPAAARPDDAAKLAIAHDEIQILQRQRLSASGEIRVGKTFAANPVPPGHHLIVSKAFWANRGFTT